MAGVLLTYADYAEIDARTISDIIIVRGALDERRNK